MEVKTEENLTGPCSGRLRRRDCHHTLHESFGSAENKATSHYNQSKRRDREIHMDLSERYPTNTGMERSISRFGAEHCRKRVELGALLPIVCHSHFHLALVLTLTLVDLNSYNMLKKRASGGDITKQLSAPEYLICSAQASSRFSSRIKMLHLTIVSPSFPTKVLLRR